MKVKLYTHDPMLTLVRTLKEYESLFGEPDADDLDDFVEIPSPLVEDLINTYNKLLDLQIELKKYRK